jgi:hypothetical protein
MRAPANKRSEREIVAEIIKCVGCAPEVAPSVQRIVQRLISDLRTAPERFSGIQKENVAFARKLRGQIVEIERTLKSPSNNPFVLSVVFEERFSQLWWNEQNTPIAINANSKRYIAQERLHQNYFFALLGRLREQCDKIISGKPGEHGGIEHQQRGAAWASFAVLESAANYTGTKLKLGCAPTSKFVRLAGLFHEAATGGDEYGADPVRACKAIKALLDAKS